MNTKVICCIREWERKEQGVSVASAPGDKSRAFCLKCCIRWSFLCFFFIFFSLFAEVIFFGESCSKSRKLFFLQKSFRFLALGTVTKLVAQQNLFVVIFICEIVRRARGMQREVQYQQVIEPPARRCGPCSWLVCLLLGFPCIYFCPVDSVEQHGG